ncbi:MAG: type II toxin-antitoxin system VapC family toxin [Candidatus Dormibacteraceae bacterium]
MITAIDTNVVLDVVTADAKHGLASADAMRRVVSEGSLIACEIVWAELAAAFGSGRQAEVTLGRLGVVFSSVEPPQAVVAGTAWRHYRRRGGPRERLIGDFLVGAHALGKADRLLTRDRGFYRRCFSGLTVIDPSTGKR